MMNLHRSVGKCVLIVRLKCGGTFLHFSDVVVQYIRKLHQVAECFDDNNSWA